VSGRHADLRPVECNPDDIQNLQQNVLDVLKTLQAETVEALNRPPIIPQFDQATLKASKKK
jgi:hypothetical protein